MLFALRAIYVRYLPLRTAFLLVGAVSAVSACTPFEIVRTIGPDAAYMATEDRELGDIWDDNALKIERRDIERQKEARLNNYRFFGAPVGILFFTHRSLAAGSLVDVGMIWQTLMLAATEAGLGSCALGSMAEYPDVIRRSLDIPEEWKVVGGLALGWPDMAHPANGYRTEREPLEQFVWQFN